MPYAIKGNHNGHTVFMKSHMNFQSFAIKFIYSEKATKSYEISTLLLTTVDTVKSKVEISQNFVAFSEYMNFTTNIISAI